MEGSSSTNSGADSTATVADVMPETAPTVASAAAVAVAMTMMEAAAAMARMIAFAVAAANVRLTD